MEKWSGLTTRIKERCGLGRRRWQKAQVWEEFKILRAEVYVERKEDALGTAKEWLFQGGTVWTDGSRIENGAELLNDRGEWAEIHGLLGFLGSHRLNLACLGPTVGPGRLGMARANCRSNYSSNNHISIPIVTKIL